MIPCHNCVTFCTFKKLPYPLLFIKLKWNIRLSKYYTAFISFSLPRRRRPFKSRVSYCWCHLEMYRRSCHTETDQQFRRMLHNQKYFHDPYISFPGENMKENHALPVVGILYLIYRYRERDHFSNHILFCWVHLPPILYNNQRDILKFKSMKTLQWLPTAHRLKPQVLIVACKVLHRMVDFRPHHPSISP